MGPLISSVLISLFILKSSLVTHGQTPCSCSSLDNCTAQLESAMSSCIQNCAFFSPEASSCYTGRQSAMSQAEAALKTCLGAAGRGCSGGGGGNVSCPNNQPSSGPCVSGLCPAGNTCQGNVCCPSTGQTCPNGQASMGPCLSGLCTTGFTCQGAVCCNETSQACPGNLPSIGSCSSVNSTCPSGTVCSGTLCCPIVLNRRKRSARHRQNDNFFDSCLKSCMKSSLPPPPFGGYYGGRENKHRRGKRDSSSQSSSSDESSDAEDSGEASGRKDSDSLCSRQLRCFLLPRSTPNPICTMDFAAARRTALANFCQCLISAGIPPPHQCRMRS